MGILFILGACTLWAVDTLIRYPLVSSGVVAEQIVFTEHLILTLLFTPYFYKNITKFWQARVSHLFYFIVIGGVGSALSTLSFTHAFMLINPSLVILLQKLQPIVAIVLARVILKESIKKEFILWASLAIIGGLLVSYRQIFPHFSLAKINFQTIDKSSLMGFSFALLAVLGWGSSTVFGKKLFSEGYSEKDIMAGRFLFGFIFVIPIFTAGSYSFPSDFHYLLKIFIMVILSGLLGMFFYYEGLKRTSARLCALAEMFFPFCAIAVNWVFLDATLDIYQGIGGVLLLLSSTIIQIRHY